MTNDRAARMVTTQLASRGVTDPRVLEVMARVPRHRFVPPEVEAQAYDDTPLPIGEGQTISQPFIVGSMTEALELTQTARVLEIGTGCGYQTAVLAEIAGQVYSVERVASLAEASARRLAGMGYANVHVRHGDGFHGWPEEAPFDRIILTAAPAVVPPALVEQLGPAGILIAPVGRGDQTLIVMTRTATGIVSRELMAVRFVPMICPT